MKKKLLYYIFSMLVVLSFVMCSDISAEAHESDLRRMEILVDEQEKVQDDEGDDTVNTVIDIVNIDVSNSPKIGDVMDTSIFSVSDDSNCELKSYNTSRYVENGDRFESGNYSYVGYSGIIEDKNIYEFWIELKAKQGYEFSKDVEIKVNDTNAGVEFYRYGPDNISVYISYSFGLEKIKNLNLEINGPLVGQRVSDVKLSISKDSHCGVPGYLAIDESNNFGLYWWRLEGNYYVGIDSDEVFEEGVSYQLEVRLIPEEGYAFDDELVVNFKGKQNITDEIDNYCGEIIFCPKFDNLCEHKYSKNYDTDDKKHWKTCSKCEYVESVEKHIYDGCEDKDCNTCGYKRRGELSHTYDDYRDETCNVCGNKRKTSFPDVKVSYRTHIQTFGWEGNEADVSTWKANGAMSGTSGLSKRLEGINILLAGNDNLGIQYTTHCQTYGWLPWSSNGDMNGTYGEAKRLEAIMIQLTGRDADMYDVYYRVHAQTYGWLNWAKNGEPAGTAGYGKRLEGIQIVVIKKDESFDKNVSNITSANDKAFVAKEGQSPVVNHPATSNTNPVIPGADTPNIAYRTHVQSYGWQAWKYNGQMSGTSGEAKRLEGININLTNKPCEGDIVYTTHVQSYGWQGKPDDSSRAGWKKNGEMSGTSGEAKRLEAICIDLTGEMAKKYDVYYRVHAQSYGWLNWAKNGQAAGTAGYGKRLEGIQVVLVKKGDAAPTNYQGIISNNDNAYIEAK